MRIRRWAINAALAGAALILAGIVVSGLGSGDADGEVSFGWFPEPPPLVSLDAQGLWAVVLIALGSFVLTVATAWTLGNNARRLDAVRNER